MSNQPLRSVRKAYLRKRRKKQGKLLEHTHNIYPLFQNSLEKDSYNYHNIRESIERWNNYSSSIGGNWNQVMKLYETVNQYGSKDQLQECTNIINTKILPYLESPSIMRKDIYKRMNESSSDIYKSCMYSMIECLNENIESDRLLKNYEIISKRFNIHKLVEENLFYEDAITETVYSLCSLVDTYQLDYKTKFCIAAESALLSIYDIIGDNIIEEEYLRDKVTDQSILETVLDYFLINYGRNNTEKFLDEMEDTCHKDYFITEQLDPYINHLRKVNASLYTEEVIPLANSQVFMHGDDKLYGMINDPDQYRIIRESAQQLVLNEVELSDIKQKVNDMVDKIKIAPTQAASMIKQAISSIFVTTRAEDIGKGTHNALSILFYAAITLGAFTMGIVPGILASICSWTISKASQKIYLKDAIQEWREHKYSLERKIKECNDSEKKRRMEAYLVNVESTLEKLENRYEEIRDRTLAELKTKSDHKIEDRDRPIQSADVDPRGFITPSSNLYDPNKPDNVKIKVDDSPNNTRSDLNKED